MGLIVLYVTTSTYKLLEYSQAATLPELNLIYCMNKTSDTGAMSSSSSTTSISSDDASDVSIVSFEKHTLGIGSKLLSKMGYTQGALRPGAISDPIELKQRPKKMGMQFNQFEEKTLVELQQMTPPVLLHLHEIDDNLIKAQGHEFTNAVKYTNKELIRMVAEYKQYKLQQKQKVESLEALKVQHSNAKLKLKNKKQQQTHIRILLQSLEQVKIMTVFDSDLLEILFKSLLFPININKQEVMQSILGFIEIKNLRELALLIHLVPNDRDLNKPFHQFLSSFPLDYDANQLLSFFEQIHKIVPAPLYNTMLDRISEKLMTIKWTVRQVQAWTRLCPSKSFHQQLLQLFIKPFPKSNYALTEALIVLNDVDTSCIQDIFAEYLMDFEINLQNQNNEKLLEILKYAELVPNDIVAVLERIWWSRMYAVMRQWLMHGIPNELENIKNYYFAWKSFFDPFSLPLQRIFYTFLNLIYLSIKLFKTNKLMLPEYYPLMNISRPPSLNLKQGFEQFLHENGLVLDYSDPIDGQMVYKLNNILIKIEDCILMKKHDEWVPITMQEAVEYANKSI